jgi:hypothetical protein
MAPALARVKVGGADTDTLAGGAGIGTAKKSRPHPPTATKANPPKKRCKPYTKHTPGRPSELPAVASLFSSLVVR